MLGRKRLLSLSLVGLTLAVGATLASLTLRSEGASNTASQVSLVRHATPVSDPQWTVHRWSLHTVRGVVNMRPATLSKKSTWAVFAIDGPKKVVLSVTKAPFALRLDTRTLPNGTYTLAVTVFHKGATPTFEAVTVVVRNTPAKPTITIVPAPTTRALATVTPWAATPQPSASAAFAPNSVQGSTSGLSQVPTAAPAPGQKF